MKDSSGGLALPTCIRFVVLLLLGSLSGTAVHGQSGPRPNILVFVADDAGWRDFGVYGNAAVHTPHIDRLARSGLTYTQAMLTTSSCSPSRISMLSGRYPHETGTEDLHMPLPEGIRLLPSYLREAGYYTGLIGKGHLGQNGHNQFERFSPSDDIGGGRFEAFLEGRGERPFFLWAAFVEPHRPHTSHLQQRQAPADVIVPPYLVDAPATRGDLAAYYDEIAYMDSVVQAYLDRLDERGLRENTLVLFLSDNGAPYPRAKGTVYDEGVRTPLLASWPGIIRAGSTYNGLVSLIDLAPTLLDVAGIPLPADIPGRSIRPTFTDQQAPGREYAFSERNWHDTDEHIRGVRTPKYRLIVNAYTEWPLGTMADFALTPSWYDLLAAKRQGTLTPAQQSLFDAPRPGVELYDVEQDPFEVRNLAFDPAYADIALTLAQVLENWRIETGDHPPYERRRSDIVDRITGIRTSWKKPSFINAD